MFLRVLLLLPLLFITACANLNVSTDYSIKPDSKKGLVVFSFTTEGLLDNYFLKYRGIDNPNENAIVLWTIYDTFDWHDSPEGRLVVVELDEGSYEFHEIRLGAIHTLERMSIPFKAKAGKVVYMGNLHVNFQEELVFVSSYDESSRDLELLFSKYKKLDEKDVIKDRFLIK
ncbi:hypothetical protein D5018_18020 [Parashewanella curva]|uniref:Uncharacterized protein n=1 Tax=Parashewanella curva TaxID=2338552 RepID=A0A3L8PSG7_9GAMM|nr:hypothetical protein [Parashewanella curva]RLV58306.1 hypothetical protein D5018_18020 [Parashewanella curva]